MRNFSLALMALLLAVACAKAQLTQTGAGSKAGGGVAPPNGSALLVDNTNPALLINNVDPACLAGGC